MTGRTRTEEVAMPTEDRATKTLAIRLDETLHARLSVLAQLTGLTITDAIRQAIELWVESQRSQADLADKAKSVLSDIEREAATRRSAIESLFGPAEAEPSESKRSGRRANG
jgi:predicted DNA-binding protein